MPSNDSSTWKWLGRMVELIAIALLALAVAHLWFKDDPGDSKPAEVSKQSAVPSEQQSWLVASSTVEDSTCDSAFVLPLQGPDQRQYQSPSKPNVIKIAMTAPEASRWAKEMHAAAQDILERTNGRVQIKFFSGGVMGSDRLVLMRIRVGSLQGGIFTPSAFQEIYPDLGIYGLPLLFRSADEADYVRKRLDGRLLQGLREAGYVSFGFATAGFAAILSNQPVRGLEDLEGLDLWIPEDDQAHQTLAAALSLKPVPLPLLDVLGGLKAGLVDAVLSPPIAAMIFQWHTELRFITDMPIVYSTSFMAIDARAFNKIDTQDQNVLTAVMSRAFCQLDKSNLADSQRAYDSLLSFGVQSVSVTGDELAETRDAVEAANRQLIKQGIVSRPLYEEVIDLVEDYRRWRCPDHRLMPGNTDSGDNMTEEACK